MLKKFAELGELTTENLEKALKYISQTVEKDIKTSPSDFIDEFAENQEGKKGFQTGIDFLDINTRGLKHGHVFVVGGY